MKKALLTSLIIVVTTAVFIIGVWLLMEKVGYADDSDTLTTTEVQYVLRANGYVLPVDGIMGPRTIKAIKHFQRVSGLEADGIVGPITSAALLGATRLGVVESSPSIPDFGGDLCAEMSWYRQQAGLPEQFDAIGYRESRCRNDAPPTNSVARNYRGWWSVGVMHIRNKVYGPGAAACGITSEWDYYGTSHEQKQASACFAKVLYDHSGMNPWRL